VNLVRPWILTWSPPPADCGSLMTEIRKPAAAGRGTFKACYGPTIAAYRELG
jgi:hypothetical protein